MSDELLKSVTNGKMVFEYFPDGYIALQKELSTGLHGALMKKLSNHGPEEIDIKLAEIAMHCSVVLDGTYTLAERDKLCSILAGRLEVLREITPGVILS